MQFLRINQDDTLIDIIKRVGAKNIDSVLNLNGLGDYRVQNIGEVYYDTVIDHDTLQENVSNERKLAILNSLIGSTDVFETAALSDESGWHTLDKTGTLSGYLRIPDDVYIPDAEDVLGDNNQVSKETYVAVIHSHTPEELAGFSDVIEQQDLRRQLVIDELRAADIPLDFDAVIGRGGLVKPISGGVYEIYEPQKTGKNEVQKWSIRACFTVFYDFYRRIKEHKGDESKNRTGVLTPTRFVFSLK